MKIKKLFMPIVLAIAAFFVAMIGVACGNAAPDNGNGKGDGDGNGGDSELPPISVTYTVSFESNGGSALADMKYTTDGAALTLPVPVMYGYDFLGWYENSELSGTSVNASAYTAASDVTLYAKWDKVVYVYFYYGEDNFENKRVSCHTGDMLDLKATFTPDALISEGAVCPFIGWRYDDGTPVSVVTVGTETVEVLASYDKSNIPAKHNYKQNADGSITATGNLAWQERSGQSNIGVYSVEVAFGKGTGGGAGIAFRMQLSGKDYPYQDEGTTYLSAVIVPASGNLQVASVTNGAFAHMTGGPVALSKLPSAWQQKYNAAQGDIKVVLTVVDYGDRFCVYIDGEEAYSFADRATLDKYIGVGLGVRCSSTGTDFAEFAHRKAVTVSFSTDGSAVDDMTWLYGPITLPSSEKQGVMLEGWYYNDGLTQKVDPNNFAPTGDITLYAKWTDAFTTVRFETFGGTDIADIGYTGGALVIPTPVRDNSYFTGWFYDEACELPVDLNDPKIEKETTVYAGWRLPKANIVQNEDGSYSTVSNGASLYAVHGVSDSLCGEYTLNFSFVKDGESRSLGIAFRMSGATDNKNPTSMIDFRINFRGYGQFWVPPGQTFVADTSANMAKFKSKVDAAATGSTVSASLKVIVYSDRVVVYLDGDLIYDSETATSSVDDLADIIARTEGYGFGVRTGAVLSSAKYTLEYKSIYPIEYVADGKVVGTGYVAAGEEIDKTLADSDVMTDGNGAYLNRFIGWYTQSIGGDKITHGTKLKDGKLYAHFERINLMTVSYDADNGEANIRQYYERGETLILPVTPPVKNGTQNGDAYIGYTFDKWLLNGADIPKGYAVTENITLVAVYTEHNAYTVNFVTNAQGLTVDDKIVAENTAVSLPELSRDGYRLDGWYTDAAFGNKYGGEAVTGAMTLYANWIEQVTVTFVSDGNTVSTQTVDKGAVAQLPADQTKASITAANKNVHSYTFNGWYISDVKATATTKYDADTVVVAVFDEVITRNGVVLEYDEAGNVASVIYGSGWTPSTQGIIFPDVALESGVFEFTFDTVKTIEANRRDIRLLFMVKDDNAVGINGNGNQKNLYINWNTFNGGITLGYKFSGQSKLVAIPPMGATSSYKKYFDGKTAGDTIRITMKIVFGKGYVKAYVNGDLFIGYGSTDHSDETNYGKEFTDSEVGSVFGEYIADPEAFGIGIQMWTDLAVLGGEVRFTDIKYGAATEQTSVPTQQNGNTVLETAYVDNKEKVSW